MARLTRMLIALFMLLVSSFAFADLININTADAETLASGLKGIGPAKAEAIIAYRTQHGGFTSVDELVQVKGVGEKILEQNRSNLRRFLQTYPDVNPADLEYTLHVGREEFKQRLAVSCTDSESAISGLENATASQVSLAGKKTVFLFPGQGSQHIRMGYGVYEAEPTFRAYVDRCSELLEPMIGVDLRTLVYASEGSPE